MSGISAFSKFHTLFMILVMFKTKLFTELSKYVPSFAAFIFDAIPPSLLLLSYLS